VTYRFFCFLQPLTVRDPGDRKRNKENQRELALARQLELVITIFILKVIILMSHQQKDTQLTSAMRKNDAIFGIFREGIPVLLLWVIYSVSKGHCWTIDSDSKLCCRAVVYEVSICFLLLCTR